MNNFSAILLFSGLLTVLACATKNYEESLEDEVAAYELISLRKASLRGSHSLPGELKPFEVVDIYPKASGFIQKIVVDRGTVVKKNQVIATLDAPEVQAELAEAEAQVQTAYGKLLEATTRWETSKDRWKRIQKASETPGAVSSIDLIQIGNEMKADSLRYSAAKSESDAAKSNSMARKQLTEYLVLRAPFDGVITKRNVHTGTYVSPQSKEPLFRLEMNQKLRLEIPLPESYAGSSMVGDTVTFEVNTSPGKKYSAVISRRAGSLLPSTRTQQIEADVENPDFDLLGGSFAQVSLNFEKKDTFVIPPSALVTSMEERFVVRIKNGKAERVPVRRGLIVKDGVEVTGDLQEGDQLVKNPAETIQHGDPVQVKAP
jgi:RND family efflux transporter MFP subunit